jgi:nitrate reductase delta subunit
VCWQAASVLLAYPDAELLGRLPVVAEAVAGLPRRLGQPFAATLEALGAAAAGGTAGLLAAQAAYVETFDLRNRRSPYLTWWTTGDTRNRGRAMLRFHEVYRAAGSEPPRRELADHLAVVLEFAAIVDPVGGHALLAEHVTPLGMLRRSLADHGSHHVGVVDAVLATLPPPGEDGLREARRLALSGPPVEAVGLDPYPTPSLLEGAR